MQRVKLIGELSQFGEEWTVQCKNINDIFKLISCQKPTFRKYLIECDQKGLDLEIIKGKRVLQHEEELFLNISNEDIIISLCPSGGKNKFVKIVIGVTLMAIGGPMGTTFGNFLFGVGVNMTLAGVTELLAPGPETDFTPNEAGNFEDELFNGPVNISKQGIPIPLLYGELIVGGAAIAADFSQTDLVTEEVDEEAPPSVSTFDQLLLGSDSTVALYYYRR